MIRFHHNAAFVIRFDPDSDIENGSIRGRVEHVASFKTKRFHSLEELLSFVGRMLNNFRVEERRAPNS
jgi:hypothetical protein